MGDNALSILIQAKIDEASTKTMQDQLTSLAKNLKSVKISLDLGDVKAQFANMFKEIEKESQKQKISTKATKVSSSSQTFTGTEDEVIRKMTAHMQGFDESVKSVYHKLKEMGNIKSLQEISNPKTGNLEGFRVKLEDIKDGLQQIRTVDVFKHISDDTKEVTYEMKEIKTAYKEVGYAMETLAKAGNKGNDKAPYEKLYKSLQQFVDGAEDAIKIADDLHNAIYDSRTGNEKKFFERLDPTTRDTYLKALSEAQAQKEEAIQKEMLAKQEEYNRQQQELQKQAEAAEKAHQDRLLAEQKEAAKNEAAAAQRRIDQKKSDMLEALRVQKEEVAQTKQQTTVDSFKNEMNSDIANLTATHNVDSSKIQALVAAMNQLDGKTDNVSQRMKELKAEFKSIASESVRFTTASSNMGLLETEIRDVTTQFQLGEIELTEYIAKLKELMYNDQGKLSDAFKNNVDIGNQVQYVKQLEAAQKAHNKELQEQKALYDGIEDELKTLDDIKNNSKNVNQSQYATLVNEYNQLRDAVKNGSMTTNEAKDKFKELGAQMKKFEQQTKASNASSKKLFDTLKMMIGIYGLYDAFNLSKRAIKSMIDEVKTLDSSLVSLNKVADLSQTELDGFVNTASEIGAAVGRTTSTVIDATTEFVKMGESVEDAATLAENALIYMNVGDLTNTEDATSAMISAMKAFGIEANNSLSIVDKINNVANNFAIDAEGIGAGLQRASSALAVAGNDIDQTLAMMATGNQVVQDPESLANGLKVISMRLRNLDENGNELESKMQDVFDTYANGIQIIGDDGEFRDTFNILNDLGKIWDSLNSKQQAFLGEKIAGKNRANIFFALMENAEDLEKALETSQNSYGSAMEENERQLDSIEGRITQVQSAWQALASNTISVEFVKTILECTTGVLEFADSVGGLVPIMVNLLGLFMTFKAQKAASIFTALISPITGAATSVTKLVKSMYSAIKAGEGLSSVFAGMSKASLFTTGLGVAITAISAFVAWQQQQKQKAEELRRENQELAESYKTLTTDLADVKTRYTEIINTSQGIIERDEQLSTLQDELATKFGIEKEQLDLLNGSYDDTIDKLEGVIAKKRELAEQFINDEIINLESDARKASTHVGDETFKFTDSQLKELEKVQNIINTKLGNNGLSLGDYGYSGVAMSFGTNIESSIEAMEEYLQLVEGTSLKNSPSYETIKSAYMDILGYQSKINEYQQTLVDGKQDELEYNLANETGVENIAKAQEDELNLLKEEITNRLANSTDGVETSALTNMLNEVNSKLQETKANAKIFADDTGDSFASVAQAFMESTNASDVLTTALQELYSSSTLSDGTIDELAKSFPELKNNLTSTTDAIAALKGKIASNTFGEATESIDTLNTMMEDLKETGGVTADMIETISSKYPSLLANIDNHADLIEAIKGKIAEEEQVQTDAYNSMLMTSNEYYEQKILADNEWVSATEGNLNDLISELGADYEVDLENYSNMEQAKAEITNQLIAQLSKAWGEYFGKIADGMSLGEIEEDYYINGDESKGTTMDYEVYRQAKEYYDFLNNMSNNFKADAPPPIKLSGKSVGSKKDSSSDSKPKASYISSIYQETADEILRGGELIEDAIARTEAKLERAQTIGDTKLVAALQEELTGFQQQLRDKQSSMRSELDVQIKEMANILSDTGLFGNYNLSNLTEKDLAEVVQKLEKDINTATLAEDDEAIDRLNLMKSKIEDIGQAFINVREQARELPLKYVEEEVEYYNRKIESITTAYDLEYAKLEESTKLLELQAILMNESGEDFKNNQLSRIDLLVAQQQLAVNKIKELKEAGLGDDNAEIQEYKDAWYDAEVAIRNMRKEMADAAIEDRKKDLSELETDLKEAQDNVSSILESTMKMVEQEYKDRKKMLEEELESYEKIIDKKKESLKADKESADNAKAIAEKTKAVTDLESKIAAIQFDTSAQGTADRLKLEEELAEAKSELEEEQADQAYDAQIDALDKELEAFKETQEEKIKEIEDYLEKEGNLRAEAIDRIENQTTETYQKLLEWNRQYGTGIDEDISQAWTGALDAMNQFNDGQLDVLSVLNNIAIKMKEVSDEAERLNDSSQVDYTEALAGTQDTMDSSTNKPTGEDYQSLIDKVAPEMNRNSDAWGDASEEEQKRLEQRNITLARQIGAWKGSDGRWYVQSNHKIVALKDLYPTYHTGGVVGGANEANLKSTEQFAKLLKGEVVVTEQQIAKFMSNTLPSFAGVQPTNTGEVKIERMFEISVQGNLDEKVLPKIEELAKQLLPQITNRLNQAVFNRGIKKPI